MDATPFVIILIFFSRTGSCQDYLNIITEVRPKDLFACTKLNFSCLATRDEDVDIQHGSLTLFMLRHKENVPGRKVPVEEVIFYAFLNDDISLNKSMMFNPGIFESHEWRFRSVLDHDTIRHTVTYKVRTRDEDQDRRFFCIYRYVDVNGRQKVQESEKIRIDREDNADDTRCPAPIPQPPSYKVPGDCLKLGNGIPNITSYISWHHGVRSQTDTQTVECPTTNCSDPIRLPKYFCCSFCPETNIGDDGVDTSITTITTITTTNTSDGDNDGDGRDDGNDGDGCDDGNDGDGRDGDKDLPVWMPIVVTIGCLLVISSVAGATYMWLRRRRAKRPVVVKARNVVFQPYAAPAVVEGAADMTELSYLTPYHPSGFSSMSSPQLFGSTVDSTIYFDNY